jgi:hypothetical protein
MIPKGDIKKWRIYFMKTTISLNSFIVSKIDGTIANHTHLEKKKFYVLIDLIVHQSQYNEGKYAHLMTKILKGQQFLGKKYADYIDVLETDNIIKVNKSYKPGKHSRSYSINPELFNNIEKDELLASSDVEVPIEYYNEIKKNRKRPKKYELQVQYDLLSSPDFQIDLTQAYTFLIEMLDKGNNEKERINKFFCYSQMIKDLYNKRIFVVEDERGRIYTNFTCIKRELRKFCSFKGQYFISLDLKSAQPYFLAATLMIDPEYKFKADVIKFYNIVTGDDIYNYLIKASGKTHLTRDNAKIELMRVFHGDNWRYSMFKPTFSTEFPTIYEYIKKIKEGQKNKLALELTKIETSIFIPVATKFCPLGALSVHDSIYFIESLKYEIKAELDKQFAEKGFKDYRLE